MGASFDAYAKYDYDFKVENYEWPYGLEEFGEYARTNLLPIYIGILENYEHDYKWFLNIVVETTDATEEYIKQTIMFNWALKNYNPKKDELNDINWPKLILNTLNTNDFLKVMKRIGHKLLFDIKLQLNNGYNLETVRDKIKYSDEYSGIQDYGFPVYWIVKQVSSISNDEWKQIIDNKNNFANLVSAKKAEVVAASQFNPMGFVQPAVPQPMQAVNLQYGYSPTNVRIKSNIPIDPNNYDGFYGEFVDTSNNTVYLPVTRPRYRDVEALFGSLLNDAGGNDTKSISEYLAKHVRFQNPGTNTITIVEALSIINLIKNNLKVKEYLNKYTSYDQNNVVIDEITNNYIMEGTRYNKAFSIDAKEGKHIIIFFNTKPYYNGHINGWINESAIKVQ